MNNDLLTKLTSMMDGVEDYGSLNITMKKHLGEFNHADVVKVTNHKFRDKEPNVSAATRVYQLMKGVQDSGLNGVLSFSIVYKHGEADQMSVQDFAKL
ncbi:MAG: hypothetical protein NVS1B10_08220 [Candidatus Saccharimonadales bacterium]